MCRYNSLLLTLTDLLKFMARKDASDLHLKPMRPPLVRIKGRLISVNTDVLQPAEIEKMLLEILTPAQKDRLKEILLESVPGGKPDSKAPEKPKN